MGKPRPFIPVKLISGFIFQEDAYYRKAKDLISRCFGPVDFESPQIDFNYTDYYNPEMGQGLKRRFVSFSRLFKAEQIAQVKLTTNRLEDKLSLKGRRRVNIDPGYVDLGKLVLATTKDHRHRVYIGRLIFAEVTLFYEDKSFHGWEWTYPDYKSDEYIAAFNRIRSIYAEQINPSSFHAL
jgi:hypothetical protein